VVQGAPLLKYLSSAATGAPFNRAVQNSEATDLSLSAARCRRLVVMHNLCLSEEACAKRWVFLVFAGEVVAPARTAVRSLVADVLALAGRIRQFKANRCEVRHSVAVEARDRRS
jgi:hypothetical protein